MKKQFLMFKSISGSQIIIDRKRNVIIKMKNGILEDITETCKKTYNSELNKPRHKDGKKIIGMWYEVLNNNKDKLSACIFTSDIILETDNQKEFDKKLFDIKKEELEHSIKMIDYYTKCLETDTQYYTYAFSNC